MLLPKILCVKCKAGFLTPGRYSINVSAHTHPSVPVAAQLMVVTIIWEHLRVMLHFIFTVPFNSFYFLKETIFPTFGIFRNVHLCCPL